MEEEANRPDSQGSVYLDLAVILGELGLALAVDSGLVSREDALRQLRRLERLAPAEERVNSRHA